MGKASRLFKSPPYPVEQALDSLGAGLRIARLRRNISLDEAAEKLGIGRKIVADAERGKVSTSVGVYVGLLWAYGLLEPLANIADPANDKEGLALALIRERSHAAKNEGLSDDF